jgi:hypothetical protein
LGTTTATNPLVELADQLCKQSAVVHAVLLKEITAISPSDPDGRPDFDALRDFFAENRKQIESLLADQAATVEELLEIGGREQAG